MQEAPFWTANRGRAKAKSKQRKKLVSIDQHIFYGARL